MVCKWGSHLATYDDRVDEEHAATVIDVPVTADRKWTKRRTVNNDTVVYIEDGHR